MKKILFLLISTCLVWQVIAQTGSSRVDELMARMTLDEKIGQLN